MDMHAPIILDLPPAMRAALREKARAAGLSPSALARQILTGVLVPPDRDAARTPLGAEERPALLAPLRALLAADLARATGWEDLQARLAHHGYTFRERGGGLALYCLRTAACICKASELGWPYAALMRRFRLPFPGHSHTWLADRALRPLNPRKRKQPDLFPDPADADDQTQGDDDIILIEPW